MRVAGILLSGALLAGCGGSEPQPPAELEGNVVEVSGAGRVTGFSVESGDERYDYLIDAERDYGFDLSHLREHQAQGDPVLVRSEVRAGRAYALEIEDA